MKLVYRIALRLSLVLLPLLALWAVLFYCTAADEIDSESDKLLTAYSERLIDRSLSGLPLPAPGSGVAFDYLLTPVDETYAAQHSHLEYYDAKIFIPDRGRKENARILTTIFRDSDLQFHELKVSMPTVEKEDLQESIFYWVVVLYGVLIVTTVGLTLWVLGRSMRPLYALLRRLDAYTPGQGCIAAPDREERIPEFRKLDIAVQRATERSEELFERQKQFIGNASHELQTPLAALGARIEWLLDHTSTDETQTGELLGMQRTLGRIVRLNKTLLLLTKIDNGQFPESRTLDLAPMIAEQLALCDEIYASRKIAGSLHGADSLQVVMNESLASVLVANLLKNAYIHGREGDTVEVTLAERTLTVANGGETPLDGERIFDRFHRESGKEGTSGLGLALVRAIGRYYGLQISYRFEQGRHLFSVIWP